MPTDKPAGPLADLYEGRIGTPTTDDEVNGYWLFSLGVLLGVLGVIVFAFTEPRTGARALGYALVALSPPLVMIGAVVRFPLRKSATGLAAFGGLLTLAAVAYFLTVFPDGWSTSAGNEVVNALYAAGIVLIGLAAAVVPLITDPVRAEYEQLQAESAAAETEHAGTAAELEETKTRVEELEEELAEASAEVDALRTSKARFELFDDRSGNARWRLRHRNGNVIASSGQGYSSRGKAQQGLHSVRRNALGAGLLRIESEADTGAQADTDTQAEDGGPAPADAESPDVAVPTEVETIDSPATFELFADDADEWRWRLRHDNGEILGDSGEGYSSKSNATRALNRVREHVAAADYLRIDPVAFELFRDTGGDWRWRLIHKNGEILGDSGEGYSSRSKARQGAESVRNNVGEDGNAEFEVYEDAGGDYRWRLRHTNGNIIADSGEGYASESGAEDAVERVRNHAPNADALDVGNAAFEIYEDADAEWRWRLRHRNGNILADSGEGYASRSGAVEAVTGVKEYAPGADAETVE
ncbi:hypothetical protein JCM17823_22160 [Halorubrum gandharaense]